MAKIIIAYNPKEGNARYKVTHNILGELTQEEIIAEINEYLLGPKNLQDLVENGNELLGKNALEKVFVNDPSIAYAFEVCVGSHAWYLFDCEAYRQWLYANNPVEMVNGYPTIDKTHIAASDFVFNMNVLFLNRAPYEYMKWFRAIGERYAMGQSTEGELWWNNIKEYYSDLAPSDEDCELTYTQDGELLQDVQPSMFHLCEYQTMYVIAQQMCIDINEHPVFGTVRNMENLISSVQHPNDFTTCGIAGSWFDRLSL